MPHMYKTTNRIFDILTKIPTSLLLETTPPQEIAPGDKKSQHKKGQVYHRGTLGAICLPLQTLLSLLLCNYSKHKTTRGSYLYAFQTIHKIVSPGPHTKEAFDTAHDGEQRKLGA